MADRGRVAATRINGEISPQARQPTEHSQLVPHEVGKALPHVGFDALSGAFDRFFSQAQNGINSAEQAVMIGEKQRIEQENDAQKAQAASDFYSGKAQDPSQTNDLDYYNTYRGLLADKTGADTAKQFQDWYLKEWAPANPTGDLTGARDAYAEQHLTGAEDPAFTAKAMETFYRSTDSMVSSQHTNAVKIQIDQGKQNLGAVIDNDAKTNGMTPERFAYYLDASRKLDPLNPQSAASDVAGMVITSIDNHPENAHAILGVLDQPGTGVNGKSFAESFPEAYSKVQEGAVKRWNDVGTIEEQSALDAVTKQIPQLKTMSDKDYASWGANLTVLQAKYGSPPAMSTLQNAFAVETERRATAKQHDDTLTNIINGKEGQDVSLQEKYLPDYIKTHYNADNILQVDPLKAGELITRVGGAVPSDWKTQLSAGLTATDNPQAQIAAARILQQVEAHRDRKMADAMMTDGAARYYDHISAEMAVTTTPIEEAIRRANTIRAKAGTQELSWADATRDGKSDADAKKAVDSQIMSSVQSYMGRSGFFNLPIGKINVGIPGTIIDDVRDYVLQTIKERGAEGVSWQTAVDDAVKRMVGRSEVLPQNGSYQLSFDYQQNATYTGADGKLKPRVKMGLDVKNDVGQSVNTVAVYETQLSDAASHYRGLFKPDGYTTDVSLGYHEYATSQGAFAVVHNGSQVVFESGEPFHFGEDPRAGVGLGVKMLGGNPQSTTSAFPDNHDDIVKMFPDLPKGFDFVPVPLASGKQGWMLSYRPNYGDQAGLTLDQREIGYRPVQVNPNALNGRTPVQRMQDQRNADRAKAGQPPVGTLPGSTTVPAVSAPPLTIQALPDTPPQKGSAAVRTNRK